MILVTGATGLVGSHLLVQLLQEKEEVKAMFRSEKQIEKVKKMRKQNCSEQEISALTGFSISYLKKIKT